MKTEKNIFLAFLLNLFFSLFEFFGGIFTGSIAILSDAVHDLGDSLSIGIAFFLERKSKKAPDASHTYGYGRYSVLGGLITTAILLTGSLIVIYHAILRIISPSEINYSGMMLFAAVGVLVNLFAAFLTREGDSVNQKAVNLHMLEDVLGWLAVLLGAALMHFTDFAILDPLLSIGTSVFILISAVRNLREIFDLLLEKTPNGIDVQALGEHIREIDGVRGVHHIHVWTLVGHTTLATMHVVTDKKAQEIKRLVREELLEHGISHATLEIESEGEICHGKECHMESQKSHTGHHHHHHH